MPSIDDHCDKCGIPYKEQLSRDAYEKYFLQLKQFIQDGRLEHLDGESTITLAELEQCLSTNTPWPNDLLSNKFQCKYCPNKFTLFADSYHGSASLTLDEE